MAFSEKDILITPNTGSSTDDPVLVLIGADASSSDSITATVSFDGSMASLIFSGSTGKLFSITNSLTGTIFSVNDISGIPSIEVLDTGDIYLAGSAGNVAIGHEFPDQLLHVEQSDITTDSVLYPLRLTRTTSGTPAIGIGTGIELETEVADGSVVGATIETVATSVSTTAEAFDLVVKLRENGSTASEKLRIMSSGEVYVPYGDSTYGLSTAVSALFGENGTAAGAIRLFGTTSGGGGLIQSTTNNLHIDTLGGSTYINYYDGNDIRFGNGSNTIVAVMGPDGDLWKGSADNTGTKYALMTDLPTVNDATLTLSTGTGLSGSDTFTANQAAATEFTVGLSLNSLAEKTGNLVGTDRLTGVSGTTHFSETISAIPLSIFNNDSGWTSNTGTLTVVNLGVTASTTEFTVTNTAGTNASLPAATASAWGVVSDDAQTFGGAKTFTADVAANAGITMDSATAPGGATDLSRHLALYGSTYGINVTPSTLNVVAGGANTLSSTATLITSRVSHTFSQNVIVTGDLTVNGTITTVNTDTLSIEDPLILLANNNNTTDVVDIGFYGSYDTSGVLDLYAGLFRDATDDKFKLFKSLQVAPTTTVDTAGTGYSVATLVANIEIGGHEITDIQIASESVLNDSSLMTPNAINNLILDKGYTTNTGTVTSVSGGTGLSSTGGNTPVISHDAHTGDVTGSTALTIANNAVTLAKMADIATASFLGRNTAATGDPEVLSIATAKTMLNLTGTNSGDQTITLTGDVTGSGTGSFATTVVQAAVTQHQAALSILTPQLSGTTTQARVKFPIWSNSTYGMGMENNYTFGGIDNNFAMTFQMDATAGRGFWWGQSLHINAQGAMALTIDGKLTLAHSIRLGYGTADTTTPGITYRLDVSGDALITGNLGVTGSVKASKENIDSTKTSAFTATLGDMFLVNTSGGAFTVTLPAGSEGDRWSFLDVGSSLSTNALTLAPNGTDKIMGVNENATVNTDNIKVTWVYTTANGWVPT